MNKRRKYVSFEASVGNEKDNITLIQQLRSDVMDPVYESERKEFGDAVSKAIRHLPDVYKDVFILHFFCAMKYPEIAEITGIPEGTCKFKVHQAVKLLGNAVKKFKPTASDDV